MGEECRAGLVPQLQEAAAGSSDAGTAAELVSETRASRDAVAKGPQMT